MRTNNHQLFQPPTQFSHCQVCNALIDPKIIPPHLFQQHICLACSSQRNPSLQYRQMGQGRLTNQVGGYIPSNPVDRGYPVLNPNMRYQHNQGEQDHQRRYIPVNSVHQQQDHDDSIVYYPDQKVDFDERKINSDHCTIISIFFCFLAPLAIINIIIGLTSTSSDCMDNSNGIVVRKWFLGIGITQAALVIGLFLGIQLFKGGCIDYECYSRWLWGNGVLVVLTMLVWGIISIVVFVTKISKLCSGFIYGYGLLCAILGGVSLLVVGGALVYGITTFRFPH